MYEPPPVGLTVSLRDERWGRQRKIQMHDGDGDMSFCTHDTYDRPICDRSALPFPRKKRQWVRLKENAALSLARPKVEANGDDRVALTREAGTTEVGVWKDADQPRENRLRKEQAPDTHFLAAGGTLSEMGHRQTKSQHSN